MALFEPQHQVLALEIDVSSTTLRGTASIRGQSQSVNNARFHFSGGTVSRVRTDDVEVPHTNVDVGLAAQKLATAERGLELLHAFVAGSQTLMNGDLFVNADSNDQQLPKQITQVDVDFEVHGSNGPLRYGSTPAGPAAAALLRPESASAPPCALASGARCVFPCVDTGSARCTWDIEITLTGADEDGRVAYGSPGHRVPMTVLASGQPAGAGGKAWDVVVAADGTRRRRWRFSVPVAVPASAIGFVVAPLAVAETTTVRLHKGLSGATHAPGHSKRAANAAASASASAGSSEVLSNVHKRDRTGGPKSDAHGKDGSAAGGASDVHNVTVEHYCSAGKVADGSAALHILRTRRMLSWVSEYLDTPYPLAQHSHVFLPDSILPPHANVQAGAAGLLPSARGTCSASTPVHGLVELDVYAMAGLTAYPDSLLTSGRVVDQDAAVHRAQALGIVRTIVGCMVSPKGWADSWATTGAASYIVDLYMRIFRGQGDWELDHTRLVEAIARLEEEHPELLPLHPTGALADHRVLSSTGGHPLREHLLALKARAVWRVASAVFKEDAVRDVMRRMVHGKSGAQGGVALQQGGPSASAPLAMGGCYSTAEVLALLKACSGSSAKANPRAALSDPVDLWAHQWLYGRGVPQLHVGVHVNNVLNQVEVVVEQILRVGAATLRPQLHTSPGGSYYADTNADMCGALFMGPLTIHVVERPETGAGEAAVPDTWAHTVVVSRPRHVFVLPCHTRITRQPLERLNELPIMKKRGRPKLERNAAVVQAAVSALSAGASGRASAMGHPDEYNDTSVLRVRIDPACAWLARMHVTAPPALLMHQLQHDPSALAQVQAMASLAAVGLGQATYVPGGIVPVAGAATLGSHFPSVSDVTAKLGDMSLPAGSQSALSNEVLASSTAIIDAQQALQVVGVVPRPIEMLTPVYRMSAVLLGINPSSIPLPLILKTRFRKDNLGGGEEDEDVDGGPDPAVVEAKIDSLQAQGNLSSVVKPSTGAPDHLDTDWRVSAAAAFALARWQTGHLPAHGRLLAVHHSYAGLGMLLALYQCLYYRQASAPVLAALAKATGSTASSHVQAMLQACASWDEAAVRSIASGGIPAPLSVQSLEDVSLRQALLAAIGSVRHADGCTPDVVVSFLTRTLQSYDSRLTAATFDDSHVLCTLATSLGQALLESAGARAVRAVRAKAGPSGSGVTGAARRANSRHAGPLSSSEEAWLAFWPADAHAPATASSADQASDAVRSSAYATILTDANFAAVATFKRGWIALREQAALELSSMRYAAMLAASNNSASGSTEGQAAVTAAAGGAGVGAAFVCSALDDVTRGKVAATVVTAVTALEAAACVPVTMAPLLRAYVPAVHAASGLPVPAVLRVAAVAGLARVLIAAGPGQHPQGLAGWSEACAALLSAVTDDSSAGRSNSRANGGVAGSGANGSGSRPAGSVSSSFRTAALLALLELQRRSDSTEEDEDDESEASSRGADPSLLPRIEHDLLRLCGLDSANGDEATALANSFKASWRLQELALDFGLLDDHPSKLPLHERRLYGPLRYGQAYHGLFAPLSRASPDDAPAAGQAVKALWGAVVSKDSRVRAAATVLLHSIVGMGPPLPLRAGAGAHASSSAATGAGSGASTHAMDVDSNNSSPGKGPASVFPFLSSTDIPAEVQAELARDLHAFADARRLAIKTVRASARSLHASAKAAYDFVQNLPSVTGTAAVFVERGEGGAEGEQGDAGSEAGDSEAGDEAKEEGQGDEPSNPTEEGAGAGASSSAGRPTAGGASSAGAGAGAGAASSSAPVEVLDDEVGSDDEYEYNDDDDEDKPKKRGRKPKVAKPAAAGSAPVVVPSLSGARPSRAASAGVAKLMSSALSGAPPDEESRGPGRPPGRPPKPAAPAAAGVFGRDDSDDDERSAKRVRFGGASGPGFGSGAGHVAQAPAPAPTMAAIASTGALQLQAAKLGALPPLTALAPIGLPTSLAGGLPPLPGPAGGSGVTMASAGPTASASQGGAPAPPKPVLKLSIKK